MNRTSAGERCGKVALVDGGSVLVGWPGAPGWTTTGGAGIASCANTGGVNKATRTQPVINALRDPEILIAN
jgi:hypothetical protein